MTATFDILIEDFLQYLRLERGLSQNTMNAYRTDIVEFAKQTGAKDPAFVTTRTVADYFGHLTAEGRKPSTLARKISGLKHFFEHLKETGRIKDNPARAYSAPKIARYHPDYLSPEEIEKIINSIDPESRNALRNRAILELLYGSGLRLSELLNLKVDDIEFSAGFIRVIGKGNKQRLVPMGEYAKKALEEYLEGRNELGRGPGSQIVFWGRAGKKFSRVGLWKAIRKIVTQAGVTKQVTPHTFRHSFATHLIAGGADLRTVQEMLGHADISTTEIYTRVDRDYIIAEHRKYHPREKEDTR